MLNTLGNYLPAASERVLMTIGGAIGAAFSFAFGNVGPLIVWLSIFVSVDMCLGVLAAVHKRRWQARVMFWGGDSKGDDVLHCRLGARPRHHSARLDPYRLCAKHCYRGLHGRRIRLDHQES